MKAVLLNDTTKIPADVDHFGCALVLETICCQLERVGIELLETRGIERELKGMPRDLDLVIVNGEGSVHDGYRQELVEVASRFPTAFINGVYQKNPYTPAVRDFRYVSVRESLSALSFREHGVLAEVVPDVIFANERLRSLRAFPFLAEVGVTDNVAGGTPEGRHLIRAHQDVESFVEELGAHRGLCVGRFHAAVVAAVLGIPFSAWKSNTHKIEGLVRDMGIPHLCFSSYEEAIRNVPERIEESVVEYVSTAPQRIERMFEKLVECI